MWGRKSLGGLYTDEDSQRNFWRMGGGGVGGGIKGIINGEFFSSNLGVNISKNHGAEH